MNYIDTYTTYYTEKPTKTPNPFTPDGALAGNGDIGLVLGGKPNDLELYITKIDMWNASAPEHADDNQPGGLSPAAVVRILMPTFYHSGYYAEQRMKKGELYCKFHDGTSIAEIRIFACACENTVVIEMKFTGARGSHSLHLTQSENSLANFCKIGEENGVSYIERGFVGEEKYYDTKSIVTLKELPVVTEGNTRTHTYVLNVSTNHDSPAYRSAALKKARMFSCDDLRLALAKHDKWWKDFWNKSNLTLADKTAETGWHGGLYIMACCSRNRNYAPGLFGNFVTTDAPGWHSDFHLNYNYQAPYYALVSSNHVELMENYDKALEDFLPTAEQYASEFLGCRGIYFPVGIGPDGILTSAMPRAIEHHIGFLGQKSNAAYAAVDMIMRWKGTRDEAYAMNHLYPFLVKLADFWEDYLVYEDGRYVVYNDCIHEEEYYAGENFVPHNYNDFNPILELGFIRMIFGNLLEVSGVLGLDEDRRAKWTDILTHISAYPTMEKDGKTVFRLTEKGRDWVDGNSLAMQHIYPAGMIGLASDKETLEIARNTFWAHERWNDGNAFNSYFTCGVRIGVDSDLILEKLSDVIGTHGYNNTLFDFGGGGVENASSVPSMVNEMLLQSFEGIVRLFPNWNRNRSASYRNFRADGAFLVSASCENGVIKAEIQSEKGYDLTLENPYSDRICTVTSGKNRTEIAPAGRAVIRTAVGETFIVN